MVRIRGQFILLLRVLWDFIQGMYAFHPVEHCVTIFGSARLTSQSSEYAVARKVGMALGEHGHTVMTGGGPGLMEAVSRGAREAGGRSVACRIRLSFEQTRNNDIDRSASFRYFFVRKVMLVQRSYALVVLPGGLGTLDELFEVLTLIQSRKLAPLPIIFIGRDYWNPLLSVVRQMVTAGTITVDEMDRIARHILVTDDTSEMIAHLETYANPVANRRPRNPRIQSPSERHAKAGETTMSATAE